MSTTFLPAANQQLSQNPQLPGLPQTGNLDSQYIAAEAQLRAQISKNYADILQQLGWVDNAGNFIPGTLSVAAGRQSSDLQRQSQLAGQDVTDTRQNAGGFLGGRTAYDIARAQYPMQQSLAQLGVDTPLALGKLYEQAAGMQDQYTIQNNILLAEMAARQAAAIAKNPAGAGTAATTTPAAPGAPGTTTSSSATSKQGGPNTSAGDALGIQNVGGTGEMGNPIIPSGIDRTLPSPIVNPNPGAPGMIWVPSDTPGGGLMPKPNPDAYGQPAPSVVSPGGPLAPGSQVIGDVPKPNPAAFDQPNPELPSPASTFTPETASAPGSTFVPTTTGGEADVMPKPNPGEYGQPVPSGGLDMSQVLDTINNAINAGPPATTTQSGAESYTQTNKGKTGKKPLY